MRRTALALLSCVPCAAAAQMPGAAARATGMAGAYTTLARGYEAAEWNPAMLGMPGRPRFSLSLVQTVVAGYSNTFSTGDFRRWSDGPLSTADKDAILARLRDGQADRPLRLGSGVDVNALSFSVDGIALTLSAFGEMSGALADDAVEIALFGNATRLQPGETFDFTGTRGEAFGGISIGASYGTRLHVLPVGILALGATVRYTRGVFVGAVQDLGSALQNAPSFNADLRLHALVADVDASTNHGSGFALDVGGTYAMLSGLRVGLVLENLINLFSWSEDHLTYSRYAYRVRQVGDTYLDSTIAEIEDAPFNPDDPVQAALRDSLFDGARPPTRVRAGVSMDLGGLVVAGDVAVRLRRGVLDAGDKRVAAGAELTALPVVRPRVGLATDLETGLSYAAGLGLAVGPVRLDAGITLTPGGERKGFLFGVGASFIN